MNTKSMARLTLPGRTANLILAMVSLLLYACSSGTKPTPTSAISQPPQTGGDLTGTSWVLVSFGTPGAETPMYQGSVITLKFDARGQAGGSGGCNSYGAQYEVKGNVLSFSELISTMMACGMESINQQEQSYFQALKTAGKFELSGDSLKIWYNNGQEVLNWQTVP